MPKKPARSRRFRLNDEPQPKAETPGAVLSKALRIAEQSLEPGVWEVWEWDDLLYRVHRLPAEKLDVRVEIVRA